MKLIEWRSQNPLKPYRVKIQEIDTGGRTRIEALTTMQSELMKALTELMKALTELDAAIESIVDQNLDREHRGLEALRAKHQAVTTAVPRLEYNERRGHHPVLVVVTPTLEALEPLIQNLFELRLVNPNHTNESMVAALRGLLPDLDLQVNGVWLQERRHPRPGFSVFCHRYEGQGPDLNTAWDQAVHRMETTRPTERRERERYATETRLRIAAIRLRLQILRC